jgi:hypothetical protein
MWYVRFMAKALEIDVYWNVQRGQWWSASVTAAEAHNTLMSLAAFEDDPSDWTIEQTREVVPVATGELVEGCSEAVFLDDNCNEVSTQPYKALHVFWQCPLCSERHNGNIRRNPLDADSEVANPSLWGCERGKGLVLLGW